MRIFRKSSKVWRSVTIYIYWKRLILQRYVKVWQIDSLNTGSLLKKSRREQTRIPRKSIILQKTNSKKRRLMEQLKLKSEQKIKIWRRMELQIHSCWSLRMTRTIKKKARRITRLLTSLYHHQLTKRQTFSKTPMLSWMLRRLGQSALTVFNHKRSPTKIVDLSLLWQIRSRLLTIVASRKIRNQQSRKQDYRQSMPLRQQLMIRIETSLSHRTIRALLANK